MSILESGDFSLWIILLAGLFLVALLLLVAFLVLRGAQKKEPAPESTVPATRDSPVAASFQSALQVLRARVTGGSFQYRAPWILLIGTPGSGKTSILDHLAAAALPPNEDQPRENKGIAWGFLNNGVLIDVPGSLLLGPRPGVPSNESGWHQLLQRLCRHRPARPLDGIVLTIGADELLDEKIDIAARGSLIRAKLDQLQSAAGLVLPVYVLVTRCDHIRGFGAYCIETDRVNPELKKEIFGWSNDHTLESLFTWVWVDEAMNAIGRAIRRHQLGFFGSPRALHSPDELYLFPPDMDVLRGPLHKFLTQLFVPVSYRDTHYFRGLYFCGPAAESGPAPAGSEPALLWDVALSRPRLNFLDHLFERKVFVEKTLARPVAQRFSFKNRIVAGAQIFAAVFSLVMAIGLIVDWNRLSDRGKTIIPVIRPISDEMKTAANVPTVDSAYSLLQMLAYLHASGFSSFFMPASWNDPIEDQIESALTDGFERIVLKAFQTGLQTKYEKLVSEGKEDLTAGGPVAQPGDIPLSTPAALREPALPKIQGLDLLPADDPHYQALRAYLSSLTALERHIAIFDKLGMPGVGTIDDVRELLEYLTGKALPADDRYRNNAYFLRAIRGATWGDIPGLDEDRKNAASQTASFISEFYDRWFEQSPLAEKIATVRSGIADLEQARPESASDLRGIGEEIADIDLIFSGDSIDWLQQPFTRQSYPALALLDNSALASVFNAEFKEQRETEGRTAWLDLRSRLLDERTGPTGPVLESTASGRLELASAVRALGSNLKYLADMDFMAQANSQPLAINSQTPVFWNGDMLAEALKLNASWEKYQHDVLPTVPDGARAGIRSIAQRGLAASMAAVAGSARGPLTTNSSVEDPLTAELKNFDQSLDKLKQLQSIGEKLGPAGANLISNLNLYRQAIRLLGAINAQISTASLYSWQTDALQKWDGSSPLSQVLYGVTSSDALADAIAADHERLRNLVQEADPVVQLLSDGGLPLGTQTVYWDKLGVDFKQFGDKKAGNPIAALETFLNHDIDKIAPENHCQSGAADPRTSDPFALALNTLRTDAARACLLLIRQRYTAIADNFTQHLAGKFPFSTDTTASVEADPNDVANFFDLMNQNGAGLAESLDRLGAMDSTIKPKAQAAVSFLKKISLVQPLFATADKDSLPALDVAVQFRSNQTRESGGDQIIDWDLKIGEQAAQYQAAPKPIRWHYGDRVTLTMRYAKDSPNVPVSSAPENDLQIGDRKVTYDYKKNWSLFALLLRHPALATDFENPLAPLPNTVRLDFGNAPGSPGTAGGKLADTIVFVTFNLQSPAAKDVPPKPGAARNMVVISGFPVSAPAIQ